MSRSRFSAFLAALILAPLVGCFGPPKLADSATLSLSIESPAKSRQLPAVNADQTVKVTVEADKGVDVYVVLSKDFPAAVDATPAELKAKALASLENVTASTTLTAKIPKNEKGEVIVRSGAKTMSATAKLTLSN